MDDDGTQTVRGQITQPSSMDEWRASFIGAMDLWQTLMERLTLPLPSATRAHVEPEQLKEET